MHLYLFKDDEFDVNTIRYKLQQTGDGDTLSTATVLIVSTYSFYHVFISYVFF